MSKQSNIKWKPSDDVKLRKTVKNFNARRNRLLKKVQKYNETHSKKIPESAVPERASVAAIRDLVATRADLNRELASLERFNAQTAEIVTIPNTQYNVQTTKWQKREMSIRAGVITKRRKKRAEELEKMQMTSGGEDLDYTRGDFGMGQADKASLKPIKSFYRTIGQQSVNKRFEHFIKESQSDYYDRKTEQLRENYVESLQHTFGDSANDLISEIESMPFDQFYKVFKAEPELFEWSSDVPEDADIQGYLTHLRAVWKPSKKG